MHLEDNRTKWMEEMFDATDEADNKEALCDVLMAPAYRETFKELYPDEYEEAEARIEEAEEAREDLAAGKAF